MTSESMKSRIHESFSASFGSVSKSLAVADLTIGHTVAHARVESQCNREVITHY